MFNAADWRGKITFIAQLDQYALRLGELCLRAICWDILNGKKSFPAFSLDVTVCGLPKASCPF